MEIINSLEGMPISRPSAKTWQLNGVDIKKDMAELLTKEEVYKVIVTAM